MTREDRLEAGGRSGRAAPCGRRAAFYVLIAFEFFYMASPFAAYFYGVYGPGLDWLEGSETTSWLIRFFLPHVVEETTSWPVDVHEWVGRVLFLGGLAGFAIGAVQIYGAKLRGRGAVTGGLYRHIRHPQYLALIVASIGMMLLWPRYLVVVATVTVIFVYIALARAEERLCLARFPGYAGYAARTGMFLPPRLSLRTRRRPAGEGRTARVAVWGLAYSAVLGFALLAASGIRAHAIDSLYLHEAPEGVYLSVVRIADEDLAVVARIARAARRPRRPRFREARNSSPTSCRTGMYVSEIPMVLPPGARVSGTAFRPTGDQARYKIVFTEAVFGDAGGHSGRDIIRRAVNKTPLAEIHVDLGAPEGHRDLPRHRQGPSTATGRCRSSEGKAMRINPPTLFWILVTAILAAGFLSTADATGRALAAVVRRRAVRAGCRHFGRRKEPVPADRHQCLHLRGARRDGHRRALRHQPEPDVSRPGAGRGGGRPGLGDAVRAHPGRGPSRPSCGSGTSPMKKPRCAANSATATRPIADGSRAGSAGAPRDR